MTAQFRPLELDYIYVSPNGAHPQLTLVLSRPMSEYEAQVVWEFFPLASASEGSTKITVHMMRRPPNPARLAKDVSRISQRAAALERQHQRIFGRYRSAAKARYQAAAKAVKKPEQVDMTADAPSSWEHNSPMAEVWMCHLRLHNWEDRENPETHEHCEVCLRCNAYRDRGRAAPGRFPPS
jgi:hypothetical protein